MTLYPDPTASVTSHPPAKTRWTASESLDFSPVATLALSTSGGHGVYREIAFLMAVKATLDSGTF